MFRGNLIKSENSRRIFYPVIALKKKEKKRKLGANFL